MPFRASAVVSKLVFSLLMVVVVFAAVPAARAVDSDGDGVDNTLDCRPTDATTWYTSSQARSLGVTGGAATSLSWLAPTPAPATAGNTVYDVLRSNGPASWASAICLVSNTAGTSASNVDLTTPSNIYFYLVRAKTACGGELGQNSSGTPTTGTSCSVANGGTCANSASCATGYCCGAACRDITTDVTNCGGCGTACTNPGGTTSCSSGTCTPVCAGSFRNCDGNAVNGCETNSATNVSHCGNCGQACNGTNGTPTCAGGSCGINCNPQFGNCDGMSSNGCETNLGTNVNHCGFCNNVCPGQGQVSANVSCAGSCQFSCVSQNYDVDNTASNGCEHLDSPQNNHVIGTPTDQGSEDCSDSTTINFNGVILSDSRVHSPSFAGFNATTGSAPDYHKVRAEGGIFCGDNDLGFTLLTSGGGATACYQLTVQTNSVTNSCVTTGAGSCSFSNPATAYSDDTDVIFKIEKTCSSATRERVTYIVTGHL